MEVVKALICARGEIFTNCRGVVGFWVVLKSLETAVEADGKVQRVRGGHNNA